MPIEQHIEELRAELRNAVIRSEREEILADLAKAEAELQEKLGRWDIEDAR